MVHYIARPRRRRAARDPGATTPTGSSASARTALVMGLEFGHPQGAKFVMRHLYENGVWAIFSTLDPRVLQFKPGILLAPALCEELLDRTEVAIAQGLGRAWPRPARRDLGDEQRHDRARRSCPEPAGVPRAGPMLERARWAGPRLRTVRPGDGAARSSTRPPRPGRAAASEYAERAVRETGFGVVAHKVLKNRACSHRGRGRTTAATTTSRRASTPRPRSSRCRARPAWCSR